MTTERFTREFTIFSTNKMCYCSWVCDEENIGRYVYHSNYDDIFGYLKFLNSELGLALENLENK